MPRQLRKHQAFLELPRHFRKCRISANACDIYTYSYLNDFHYLNGKTAFLIIINMKNRFACKTNRHAVNFIYLKMFQNTVKLVLTTTCQQWPIQNRPKQFYYITEPPNNDHLSTTASDHQFLAQMSRKPVYNDHFCHKITNPLQILHKSFFVNFLK